MPLGLLGTTWLWLAPTVPVALMMVCAVGVVYALSHWFGQGRGAGSEANALFAMLAGLLVGIGLPSALISPRISDLFAKVSPWGTWTPWQWVDLRLMLLSTGAVFLPFAIFALLSAVAPKVAAVAWATAKDGMAQPLFAIVLILGMIGLILFPFIPYNTFGEDVKVLKDEGLTLIMVLSIILALWTASVSISEEVEGKTALTLLSKPVGRRQLIIGKFLGIQFPVYVVFLLLGALFLMTVGYKVDYDSIEAGSGVASLDEIRGAMVQVIPGLTLAFMEAAVLSAVSVAISTRLPMLANLVICSSVYVLGNLVPMIVQSPAGKNEIVGFVGKLIAIMLPVLDHFNIQAAVATGRPIPLAYLLWTLVYGVLYASAALLIALILFEDRDLA